MTPFMTLDFLSSDPAIALYGAFAGAFIAVAYDALKTTRRDRARDHLILNLLHTELEDIRFLLGFIERRLNEELALSGQDALLDEPLPPVDMDLLEVLRLGIPKVLVDDKKLFVDLRGVQHTVRELRELLSAREAWRRDKALMTGVRSKVVTYDRLALDRIARIRERAQRALTALDAHAATLDADGREGPGPHRL